MASHTHTHSYGSSTALTTSGNSGSAVAAVTGYGSFSGGSITPVTKYLTHTHTGASLGTPSTKNAAPHTHTHSYGSSTALTTSGNSGTNFDAVTGVTGNGTATAITGITINAGATTKYLLHSHTGASASGTDTFLKGVKAIGETTVITGVTSNGTATVLTGVKVNGAATVIKSDGLSTSTANSITSLGSVPSLSYESISIKGVDSWSAGALPTKGSAQTVVTSVNTTTGGASLTTNTPS